MPTVRPKGRPLDLAGGEMRERILREAARLFSKTGYAGTSVQAIVDAAGTTKPMVYYYFQGKEGLYRELVEEAYRRVRRRLERIDVEVGDIEADLLAVAEAHFELYRESPGLARLYLTPILMPQKDAPRVDVVALGRLNFELVRQIVSGGIGRGEIEGRSEEIALSLTGHIFINIMAQSVYPDLPIVGPEAAGRLVQLLLDGVRVRR